MFEEKCLHCKQPRPRRNISTPTNAYESFEDFIDRVELTDGQIRSLEEESLRIIKEAYDDGADLDNDFVSHRYPYLASALDDLAIIKRIKNTLR